MPNRWQAIIWTNADPIHWRIYVALRGDELRIYKYWDMKFVLNPSGAETKIFWEN